MGYEETAETSPEIVQEVARRTLEEGKRVFPALRVGDRGRHQERVVRTRLLHIG